MSYGAAFATLFVSLVVSVLAGVILSVFEERYAAISVNLLRLAAWLQPPEEREEFIDEALGNLGRTDGRYRTMSHAVGLVVASVRIRHVWNRETHRASNSPVNRLPPAWRRPVRAVASGLIGIGVAGVAGSFVITVADALAVSSVTLTSPAVAFICIVVGIWWRQSIRAFVRRPLISAAPLAVAVVGDVLFTAQVRRPVVAALLVLVLVLVLAVVVLIGRSTVGRRRAAP